MTDHLTKDLIRKGLNFTLTVNDFVLDGKLNLELYMKGLKQFAWFFIEQFQNVKDPGGTIAPVKLNRIQRYFELCKYQQLKEYNYARLWILKPRQIGSSWFWARHANHHAIWYNHLCKIMAHAKDQTAIKSLFGYVYEGYSDLLKMSETHEFLKPYLETSQCSPTGGVIKYNGLSHGSIEVLTSEISAVGFASQHAHISEIPLIDNFPEFWDQYSQSLHEAYYHVVACESSAHHSDQFFLDEFDRLLDLWKSKKRLPPMRPVFIPCYMHEEYKTLILPSWYNWQIFWAEADTREYGDEKELVNKEWYDPLDNRSSKLPLTFWKWRRDVIDKQKTDGMGGSITKLDVFHENFPMTYKEARLSMGSSVFDRHYIMYHKKHILPPVFEGGIYLDEITLKPKEDETVKPAVYRRWDEVNPGFEYFIGVDTANEREGDKTVAVVFSPKQNALVACLVFNEEETHVVTEHLIAVAKYWNNAMIGYESNLTNVGDTILRKLLGTDRVNPMGAPYRNIYWERPKDQAYQTYSKNRKYGCQTSAKKKGIYKSLTDDFLADKSADIWIPEYLNEVWAIEQKANREGIFKKAPAAPRGRHDDYWIAVSVALYIARDCERRREDFRQQLEDSVPDDVPGYPKRISQKTRPKEPAESPKKYNPYAQREQRSKRVSGRFSH